MKKVVKLAVSMIVAIMLTIVLRMPIMAANGPEDSVVKIVWTYLTDQGVYADIKYGTSFLINENTVLTNYHNLVFINTDEKNYIIKYLNDNYGLNLTDLAPNDRHFHCYILPNRDTRVDCTIDKNVVSDIDHLDLVALQLSTPILDRTPATLGNSSSCKITDQVFAFGFPTDSLNNKEENTVDDVSVVGGNISKMTVLPYADVIEHSAQLGDGNSGGPLCNTDGYVVGINEYIIDKKNYSIQIDQVKSILDTYGISYNSPDEAPAPTATPAPGSDNADPTQSSAEEQKEVNTRNLENAIEAGRLKLKEKLKKSDENNLQSALNNAENTLKQADSQEAVDKATTELNNTIDEIQPITIDPMIIAAIAAALIVLLIVILLIVNSNNKKKAEQERRRRSLSGGVGDSVGNQGVTYPNNNFDQGGSISETTGGVGNVNVTTNPVAMGNEGTLMLDQGADGTTILNNYFEDATYLIRKKTGERVVISNSNFTIGKEKSKVDYCITDNTAISRTHAVIKKEGDEFVLVDQKSTNCSYVDGAKAYANQPVQLRDGSIIKLADEEFEFHKA